MRAAGGPRFSSISASIPYSRCSARSVRTSPMLIVTRFLAGIGIGAELPLVDAYLERAASARDIAGATPRGPTRSASSGVPAAGFLARHSGAAASLRHRRVALDVRRRLAWCRHRLDAAREAAGVAALARIGRTHPRRPTRSSRAWSGKRRPGPTAAADHRTKRHRGARTLPDDLRPALSRTHADAVRLPRLSDGRLLRLRHARADRAGGEGLFDRDVADVHVAHLHRLSDRLGAVAADRRTRSIDAG